MWQCGCGAKNLGDLFSGTCWRCLTSWGGGRLDVVDAVAIRFCAECRASPGFHYADCPVHPMPGVAPRQRSRALN